MATDVRIEWDDSEYRQLFETVSGPTGVFLGKKILQVERSARRRAPRRTGELRTDIRSYVDKDDEGLYADAGTDVLHGRFQELGHRASNGRFVKPRRYLRPALRAARRSVK